MREYREFFEGDRVMVVSEPYLDCPFTWINDMTALCGKTVTICRKKWSNGSDTYAYQIEEDGRSCSWCGNCFVLLEPEEELPEIEDDSFLSAIHMGGGEAS